MSVEFEIVGGAGPRETAAIMAALVRIAEEQSWDDETSHAKERVGVLVFDCERGP